jgi:hypothetical protein
MRINADPEPKHFVVAAGLIEEKNMKRNRYVMKVTCKKKLSK